MESGGESIFAHLPAAHGSTVTRTYTHPLGGAGVYVGEGVSVAVGVAVDPGVAVGVDEAVAVVVGVLAPVGLAVAVRVGVVEPVGVALAVGVRVDVAVRVAVGMRVEVAVGRGVKVGTATWYRTAPLPPGDRLPSAHCTWFPTTLPPLSIDPATTTTPSGIGLRISTCCSVSPPTTT